MCTRLSELRTAAIEEQTQACENAWDTRGLYDGHRYSDTEESRERLLIVVKNGQHDDALDYAAARHAANEYRRLLDHHRATCGEQLSIA